MWCRRSLAGWLALGFWGLVEVCYVRYAPKSLLPPTVVCVRTRLRGPTFAPAGRRLCLSARKSVRLLCCAPFRSGRSDGDVAQSRREAREKKGRPFVSFRVRLCAA